MHRRKRRLEGDELSRIEAACKKCKGLNQLYIPLAVYLAIETGMRLQEIFNLTWKDIEFKKRRIEIRKSKTDYNSEYAGRTIVLPIVAEVFLQRILVKVMLGKTLPDMPDLPSGKIVKIEPTSLVFPMTKDAFKQAWVHVLRNAGIKNDEDTEDRDFNTEEGLTFHDLRREAGSWFDEAGLTKSEHDLMMGHKSRDMTGLYIGSTLKSIQDKLDRHRLEGKTFEEAYKLALERRKDKADKDMTVEEAVTNVIRIDFGE